ncbi:MAG: hypothetical protein WBX95_18545 [Xanthobacteraceae bacterium]
MKQFEGDRSSYSRKDSADNGGGDEAKHLLQPTKIELRFKVVLDYCRRDQRFGCIAYSEGSARPKISVAQQIGSDSRRDHRHCHGQSHLWTKGNQNS